jgi:hypothetical protein
MSGAAGGGRLSTTELELTFSHEIIDLAEEVLRSIRLGDKPAVVGNVGRRGFI